MLGIGFDHLICVIRIPDDPAATEILFLRTLLVQTILVQFFLPL